MLRDLQFASHCPVCAQPIRGAVDRCRNCETHFCVRCGLPLTDEHAGPGHTCHNDDCPYHGLALCRHCPPTVRQEKPGYTYQVYGKPLSWWTRLFVDDEDFRTVEITIRCPGCEKVLWQGNEPKLRSDDELAFAHKYRKHLPPHLHGTPPRKLFADPEDAA